MKKVYPLFPIVLMLIAICYVNTYTQFSMSASPVGIILLSIISLIAGYNYTTINRFKRYFVIPLANVQKKRVLKKTGIIVIALLIMNLFVINNNVIGQIALRGSATTGSNTGNNLTINKPTGVVAGDVMIVNICKYPNNITPTLSGWTLITSPANLGGGTNYGYLLYRVADGSEGASFTFALGATTYGSGTIVAFSGVDVTGGYLVTGALGGPFDVTPGSISTSGGYVNSQSVTAITTNTVNAAVIMFGMNGSVTPQTFNSWTTASPGALTEIYDNNGATFIETGAAWATKATAGSTGTSSLTLSGNSYVGGILIALKALCSKPATPGTITQPGNECASSTGNTFSISAVSGATSYTWSVTGTGWSVTGGGTTTSATITIGTGVGTVSVTATNACGTSAASTTGNITPTTAPATPGTITQPANKCASSTGNIFSISAVSGAASYTWSVTGTGWVVTSGGTTTSATITIGSGVGTVSVTATNACGTSGASTTGNITPISTPTVNAGSALAAICQGGTSAALGGSIGGSATGGTWSDGGVGGTFNPNAITLNATWTPPAGYSGTATLTLTASGSSCGSPTSSKTELVYATPTANAGSALAAVCQGGTSAALGGSIGGSATGGTWSDGGVGGTFNPNATTLNATWTPPAGYSGTATLTLTASGSSCGSPTSSKTELVYATPTANAGSALAAICQGGTSAALGGSIGGSATGGTWSSSAGGTFNPNATTLNATWTPPAGYSGTATLTLTASGSSCGSPTSSKTELVYATPTANAGSALAAVCQGGTSAALGGSIGGSATGGTWSDGGVGGTFNPNAITLNATWTPPAGYSGTATLTLTASGSSCGSPTSSKTELVYATPTANAGSALAAICQGGTSAALGGSIGGSATGGTWSDGGVGGTFSPGATTLNATWTPPAGYSGTATLTLTASGSSCGSPTSSKTELVYATPTANAGSALAAVCQGGTSAALGGSIGGSATGGTWSDGGVGGTFNPNATTLNATWTPPAGYSGTATLTLTASGSSCGSPTSSKTELVNLIPTVNAGSSLAAICQGGTTIALGGSFGGGATAAIWSDGGAGGSFTNNGGSTPNTTTYTAAISAPSIVTLTLTTSGGSCGTTFATNTLTVNPLPTATISGTVSACQNDASPNITFTGANGTAPYTFTYTINGGSSQTVYTTSGNSVTVTAPTTTPGTFTYSLVSVQDNSSTACMQLQTGSAVITVNNPVVITSQPSPVTQTICATYPASFTVAATGDITGYQWYFNGNPLSDNANISGSQTATLNFNQVGSTDAGTYYVVITGTSPCPAVTSSNATLIVNQDIIINTQPASQTLCVGNTATFNIVATGTSLTYQWSKNGVALTDGGNISGSSTSTLIIANITAADVANYSVVASDGVSGCPNVNSLNATLTVNATSVGGTVGTSTTVCSGTNSGTLTVTGITGNVIRWEFSVDGGTTWTTIANTSTSQSYTNLTQTTLYRAVVQSGVCPSNNSTPATITVNPIPDALATPSGQAICSGTAITTIALTGSVTGTIFSWTRDNTGTVSGIASSGTGDISGTLTNLTSAPVTVSFTVTPTASSCVGTPIIATVTVNPTPTVTNTFSSPTYCNGATGSAVSFTSNVAGATFSWTSSVDVGFGTSGSGNIASYTATNAGNSAVTATITVTATANGCSGAPKTYTVTVNPTSNVTNTFSSPTYCNGATGSAVSFTSNVAGATFSWTSSVNVGFGTSGSGNIASYTATNAGNTVVTATVTVTATNGGCAGPSQTFTVTVNPTPTVTNTFSSPTYCNGATGSAVSFTSNVAGATFSWTSSVDVGFGTSGSGNIASYTATNAGNSAVTATITVTATANGCSGAPKTYTVTVNPTSNVTNTFSSPTYCNGATGSAVSFTSNVAGATFSWTSSVNVGFGTSGSGNIASYTATNAGNTVVTATVTVTATNGGCAGPSQTFTVTVNPTPTVTNTFSSPTYCNGATGSAVSFTSNVAGATFSWTSSVDVGFGTSGSGNIASYTATNAGNSAVTATITVTATANGCSGAPKTYTVTVNPTSNVTNTFSSPTYCNGATGSAVSFTSNVAGATFSWTSSVNVGFGTSGSGNIASYTATNAGNTVVTATVTVTATNGGCAGPSQTFTVTVNPTPTVTNTFSSPTYCNGATGSAVSFTSNVAGATFSWTSSVNVGFGTSGSGNIASYTATNAGNSAVTATITVTATANGCSGAPKTYTVTVNPTSNVTNTFSSPTYCNGATGSAVSFTSNVAGATFSWTSSVNVGFGTSGSGNIASYTATNAGNTVVTATVTVTATNGGCAGPSQTFTVTVNPTPTVTNTFSSPTYCNGATGSAVSFTSNVAGATFSWTSSVNVGFGTSGSGNIASYTATNAGNSAVTATITVTATANGCSGAPKTYTVTVNPTSNVTNTFSSPTYCNGATGSAVSFTSNVAGATFSWTSSVNVGFGTSGSGNIASYTATNAGNTVVTATVTVTATNGGCAGPSQTFTVTVNPTPTVTNTFSSPTYCNGATGSAVSFTSNVAGATFSWTSSVNVGFGTSGSGNIASYTATNAGNSAVTATITVTATANGCSGAPKTYTVTVNPTSNVTNTFSSPTYCNGATGSAVSFTSNVAGATFSWTSTANVGFGTSGSGNIASYTATNAGSTAVTATVTVTASNGGCAGPTKTFTVTVNPSPTAGAITGPTTVCTGSTISLTSAGSGIGTLTYSWGSSTTTVATVTNSGVVTGTYVGATSGTSNITYKVTDGNGCSSTSANYPVTVYSVPSGITVEFTQGLDDKTWTYTLGSCAEVGGGGQNDLDINSGNPAGNGATTFGSATGQWQVSYDGGTTWSNAPGPTSTTPQYVMNPVYINVQNVGVYKFRVIITNGGCSGISDICTLNVVAGTSTLNPGTIASNQSYCGTHSVTPFTQTSPSGGAGSGSYTYQWESSTDGVTWSVISGATGSTYSSPSLSQTTYFQRIVVSSYNCVDTTNIVTVAINSAPPATPGAITGTTPQCPALTGQVYSIAAVTNATTYTWTVPTGWTITRGTGTNSITVTTGAAGQNGNITVTAGNGCGTSSASSLAVTVNSNASITTQPSNSTICQNTNTSFSVVAAGTGITYQWQVSTNGGTTWNNVTNTGIYTGATTATVTLTNVPTTMNSYQYKVVITGTCSNVTSNAVTLTVNTNASITTQPLSSTICQNNNTSFSVVAAGTGLTYQWQLSTDGGTTWNNVSNGGVYTNATTATLNLTNVPATMNSYQYKVVITGTCSNVTSNAVTLTVNTNASITTQPSNSTICQNTNTSFSVVAAGTGITYQWQVSTNGGTTWNNVTNGGVYSGATTATVTLTNVPTTMNSYQYRVVITGTCSNVTSSAVTLTVNTNASITTQPLSSTICQNTNTSFSVVATGTGLTYQWQLSTDGGTTWNNVSNGGVYTNATTATLNLTNVPATMNSYQYKVVITGTCSNVTSNAVTLTVNTNASITTQPSNSTICQNTNTSFSVVAAGTGITYQWQVSTNGGTTWNNVTNGGVYSGATTATVTLTNVPTTMNSYQYRVVITGTCSNVTSSAVTLTVNTNASITTQPLSSTICQNTNTSFSVVATGTGLTYQWQLSTDGGTTWNNVSNGGVYTNATTATLNLTNVPATMNSYQYKVVITGTCSNVTSNAVTLTVNTNASITTQPSNSTICQNTNTSFSVVAAGTGITYQWQVSTNGGTTWNNVTNGGVYSGATTATVTLTNVPTTMNSYQYRVVITGTCSNVTSSAVTLTVNTNASITTQPLSSTICQNTNTSFSVVATGTGLTYQWQLSTDGGTTWNNVSNGGVYTNATTATLNLTNVPATMNSYQYKVVITGTCSNVTSSAVTLTVNPTSVAGSISGAATVCSGTNSTTLTLSGNTGTIQWQSSPDNATWSNIGGATGSTYTATNLAATTYYQAVVTSGVCSSATTGSVTVTVSPTSLAGSISGAATVCTGTNSTTLTLSGNTGTIQWQSSPDNATWSNISGATSSTYTATNLINTTYYRVVVTSGVCSSSSSAGVTITVNNFRTWLGVNTDWFNPLNWCGGVPTSSTDVIIPGSLTYYPDITSGTAVVNNITIQGGGSVILDEATMQIYGSLSNSGIFDATEGTIELKGSSAQTIDGSMFVQKTINNLTISNTSSIGVSVAGTALDTLMITGELAFGDVDDAVFNTNNNLALLSRASATARVSDLTNGGANSGNSINGKVIIERYIPAHRAWRLLTAPISSPQSINASWQEGYATTTPANLQPTPPVNAGYGTEITNIKSTVPGLAGTGYDAAVTNNPSIKYISGGAWAVPPSTTGYNVNAQQGYMLFVRGDRTVVVTTPPFNPATPTVLRVNGTLKEGTQSYTPPVSGFNILGNPFASEVGLDNIFANYYPLIGSNYYVWDPWMTGSESVGAFFGVSYDGTDGSGNAIYSPSPHVSHFNDGKIESSEAFLFYFSGTDSLAFNETDKSAQSALVFRPVNNATKQLLTLSLNTVNSDSSISLDDGTMVILGNNYSDSVNWLEDAPKISNPSENISTVRNGKTLAIEKRQPLTINDTIYIKLVQLLQQNYQLEVSPQGLAQTGLAATLLDSFMHTATPLSLSGISNINFNVTADAASQGANRFRIVFNSIGVTVPVTYTNVTAWKQNNSDNIAVQWQVENQINIKKYVVQKSTDGHNFTDVASIGVSNPNLPQALYNWTDSNTVVGGNFYRVMNVNLDGSTQYSKIVSVIIQLGKSSIAVYPNPVENGIIGLQFINMPKDRYNIRLLDNLGQVILSKVIDHPGGSATETIPMGKNLARGNYQLEVVRPGNTKNVIQVLY